MGRWGTLLWQSPLEEMKKSTRELKEETSLPETHSSCENHFKNNAIPQKSDVLISGDSTVVHESNIDDVVFQPLLLEQKFANKSTYEIKYAWINIITGTLNISDHSSKDRRHKQASLTDVKRVIAGPPEKFKSRGGGDDAESLKPEQCLTLQFSRGGGVDLKFKGREERDNWNDVISRFLHKNELIRELKDSEKQTAHLKKSTGDSPCQQRVNVDCEITEEEAFPERIRSEQAMTVPIDSLNKEEDTPNEKNEGDHLDHPPRQNVNDFPNAIVEIPHQDHFENNAIPQKSDVLISGDSTLVHVVPPSNNIDDDVVFCSFDLNSSDFKPSLLEKKFISKSTYEIKYAWINIITGTLHISDHSSKDRRHQQASLTDVKRVIAGPPEKYKSRGGGDAENLKPEQCLTLQFSGGGGVDLKFKGREERDNWNDVISRFLRKNELIRELKDLEKQTAHLKKSTGDSPCQHVHCQCWGGKFMCKDCSPIREITEEDFPEKVRHERAMMQQLGDEDHSEPSDSVNRGVTIGFLVALCEAFDLFDLTTEEVLRDYVIPMTSGSRCRFVDLDAMRRSGVVGTAVTFISHTWKGKFGDLVAALIDGGADLNRFVWVDIFSVRQWPTTKPDLNFEEVIKRVRALLIVCPYLKEVEDVWGFGNDLSDLPVLVRAKIPFLRLWCLYELVYASLFGIVIVMKGGSFVRSRSKGDRTIRWEPKQGMLIKLSEIVDVEKADATVAADRKMIFDKIHAFQDAGVEGLTGVAAFNSKAKGIILGSAASCDHPELQCALCGDPSAIASVRERAADFINPVAAGGYLNLLSGKLRSRSKLICIQCFYFK